MSRLFIRFFSIYILTLMPGLISSSSYATLSSEIEYLTGNRTKIIFARCVSGNGDLDLTTPDYSIASFDTYRGEIFEIVPGPRYCANPIITPDGNDILFSDLASKKVFIASWCGAGAKVLVSGYGLCVQRDTSKKIDWVYVSDSAYGNSIYRYNIRDVNHSELVWDQSKVSIRFTVSADGLVGGGEFPWPDVNELSLKDKTLKKFGTGCNAALAPDNSYKLFHMDGDHKSIWMYDSNANVIKQILFTDVPGIEEFAAWIPRWTSDVRFITLTAPFQAQPVKHKADIFFGAFDADFDSITTWINVTNTADVFENYAYSWIGKESYLKLNKYEILFSRKGTTVSSESRQITAIPSIVPINDCSISCTDDWLFIKHTIQNGKIVIEHSVDSTRVMDVGLYFSVVTIKCSGYADESYRVNLRIDDVSAVPESLTVAPNDQLIPQFDSVKFIATCYDQFQIPLATSCSWSVTGGGSIDSIGLFRSNGDTGIFTIRACVVSSPDICDSTNISIYENPRIITPDSTTTIMVGDSLVINWVSCMAKFTNLMVYISLNKGKNWRLLNSKSAIYPQYSSSGSYTSYLPLSLCSQEPGREDFAGWDDCLIKITDYHNQIRTISKKPFTIRCTVAENNIVKPSSNYRQSKIKPDQFVAVKIFTLSGRVVYRFEGNVNNYKIDPLPEGIYFLKISSNRTTIDKKLSIW